MRCSRSFWQVREAVLKLARLSVSLRVLYCVIRVPVLAASLSAQALGRITSFSPDAGRARAAARNVFKIIDSVSNSSASTSLGDRYQGAAVVPSAHIARTGPVDKRAHIEFRDVT